MGEAQIIKSQPTFKWSEVKFKNWQTEIIFTITHVSTNSRNEIVQSRIAQFLLKNWRLIDILPRNRTPHAHFRPVQRNFLWACGLSELHNRLLTQTKNVSMLHPRGKYYPPREWRSLAAWSVGRNLPNKRTQHLRSLSPHVHCLLPCSDQSFLWSLRERDCGETTPHVF